MSDFLSGTNNNLMAYYDGGGTIKAVYGRTYERLGHITVAGQLYEMPDFWVTPLYTADAQDNATWRAGHDVWDRVETQPSPETDADIRFTNYIYDPVIGKYFAQARFCDSANGRMLAPDPVKRNINPYPYCDNDPVNYNDPTGEIANILVGEGGFSLGGFVRDVLTGAVVGGLGSAGFYGAGKAVEELRGSVAEHGCYTDVLDSSNMMFRKGRDASNIEPMPRKQLQRIVKAFKRQGGIIQMDDVTDAYLVSKNAEGVTLNENTILLRQNSGRASVYEELIHATQFRQGLNDASVVSRIQNEIVAQKMLLRNSEAYI